MHEHTEMQNLHSEQLEHQDIINDEGCGCGGSCSCHSDSDHSHHGHERADFSDDPNNPFSNMAFEDYKDKHQAFSEAYRIMKHHEHLQITDIVIKGDMPASMAEDAGVFMGYPGGILKVDEYLEGLAKAGFEEIILHEEMKLELPDAMLHFHLPPEEAQLFREGEPGIYSIVVTAAKPCCHAGEEDHVCCGGH